MESLFPADKIPPGESRSPGGFWQGGLNLLKSGFVICCINWIYRTRSQSNLVCSRIFPLIETFKNATKNRKQELPEGIS